MAELCSRLCWYGWEVGSGRPSWHKQLEASEGSNAQFLDGTKVPDDCDCHMLKSLIGPSHESFLMYL